MQNITTTRRQVIAKARQIFKAGISESWSDCMTWAWAFVKTANKVKAGESFSFVKKTTGKVREVAAPAVFVPQQKTGATKKSNRKPNPCLLLFVDTQKGGTRSCDVRTVCA